MKQPITIGGANAVLGGKMLALKCLYLKKERKKKLSKKLEREK